jgi:hypothetical protein
MHGGRSPTGGKDYNEQRPHRSLGYKTPAEFAAAENCGKDAGGARLENAVCVSHFPTVSTATRIV